MHNCSIFVGSLARHCSKRAARMNKKCLKISTASLEPKMLLAVGVAEMPADLCHIYTNATPTTIKYNGKRPRLHTFIYIYIYIAMWKSNETKTNTKQGEAKRRRSEEKNEKRYEEDTKRNGHEYTHTYMYIYTYIYVEKPGNEDVHEARRSETRTKRRRQRKTIRRRMGSVKLVCVPSVTLMDDP